MSKTLEFLILRPTFFMENLIGTGLEQGQLALPLSPLTIQQSALEDIAEFSALMLEAFIDIYFDTSELFLLHKQDATPPDHLLLLETQLSIYL